MDCLLGLEALHHAELCKITHFALIVHCLQIILYMYKIRPTLRKVF